jgi:hypothetical protein
MPLASKQGREKQDWVNEAVTSLNAVGYKHEQSQAIAEKMWNRKDCALMPAMVQSQDYSGQITKAVSLNNILKVPVVMAAEMVQPYHRDELPPFVQDMIPEDITFVNVFKPYEELCKAIDHAVECPYVEPHSVSTFHKDNKDPLFRELVPFIDKYTPNDYIRDEEVIGWVKDFSKDDTRKVIKGILYINKNKAPSHIIERLERGETYDVSIGFSARFERGGKYKTQDYLFKQVDMILGHLAGLPHDNGKCPRGMCGTNMDKSMFKKEELYGLSSPRYQPLVFVDTWFHDSLLLSSLPSAESQNTFKYDTASSSLNPKGSVIMPTLEEQIKILQEQMAAKDSELVKLRASNQDKQMTELAVSLKDTQVKLETTSAVVLKLQDENKAKDQKIKDLAEVNAKFEDSRKQSLIADIVKANLKDMTKELLEKRPVKEIETIHEVVAKIADKALSEGGLPKPEGESREQVANKDKEIPTFMFDSKRILEKPKEGVN